MRRCRYEEYFGIFFVLPSLFGSCGAPSFAKASTCTQGYGGHDGAQVHHAFLTPRQTKKSIRKYDQILFLIGIKYGYLNEISDLMCVAFGDVDSPQIGQLPAEY